MAAATKKKSKSLLPPSAARNRVFGSIVLERFAAEKVPASLQPSLKTFTSAHAALKTATTAIEDAHGARSHAEGAIAAADKQLTSAINSLGNAFVGAGLGPRRNPFTTFSKHAPGQMADLAYARKVKAARALVKTLKPKKLPATVAAAAKALGLRANDVATALGAVSQPGVTLTKAQRSLGTIAATWTTSYQRLKTLAAAAWIDEPDTFKAIFAKPAKVQAPAGAKRAAVAKKAGAKKIAAAAKAATKAQAQAANAQAKAQAAAAKAQAKLAAAAAAGNAPTGAAAVPVPVPYGSLVKS